jgi:hypothetical protein
MTRISHPFAVHGASGLFLLSFFLVGCGDGRPSRVPVSGRVTIDGKPLPTGSIQVCPANDRAAMGNIGPDGRFKLTTFDPNDGCVIGKHRFSVAACEYTSPRVKKWHAPKKYADIFTSGLELDVTGPTDNMEIKLTWDGGNPFTENEASGEDKGAMRWKRK